LQDEDAGAGTDGIARSGSDEEGDSKADDELAIDEATVVDEEADNPIHSYQYLSSIEHFHLPLNIQGVAGSGVMPALTTFLGHSDPRSACTCAMLKHSQWVFQL
jgi:hypothetical protein